MSEEKRVRVRLGGLWTHKTKQGDAFLSGSLGNAQLVIYENGFKKTDKDPTHIAYLQPNPGRVSVVATDNDAEHVPF